MARKRKPTTGDPSPLAKMSSGDYKLEDAPIDWLRWAMPIETYILTRLIPIDHWFEERMPKQRGEEPWVEVLDEDEENTVYQVIASMIRPATRKTMGLLDGTRAVCYYPFTENPEGTEKDLDYAGRAVTDVFKMNMRANVANRMTSLVYAQMLRGMYFRQHEFVGKRSADWKYDCPIRHTVHDVFDVRWDLGADLEVKRCILRKTVTWSMLSEEMKTAIGAESEPAWNRQLRMFEVLTETHHGVLVQGKVAKPMTPHGYDFCPVTVGMHEPTQMRQNMQPQKGGQWSPNVAYWVGRPVCEDLLLPAEFDSRLMTAMFENTKRTAITPLVGKGLMLREDEQVIDLIQQGLLPLEDSVTSDVHYLTTPDGVSNGLRLKQEYDKRQTDVAGASPETYSGQVKDRTSTSAASEMTSWTRAAAEAVRTSILDEMVRSAQMDAKILAKQYKPSTFRKVEREAPELIAALGDALHLPEEPGTPYPGNARLTGDDAEVIDGLTFKYATEPVVFIPPPRIFSTEQGWNVGLQVSNLPPENKLLSRRTILTDLLMIEDVDAEMAEVYSDELMADAGLPLGKLIRLQKWVETKRPELGAHFVAEIEQDIERAIPEAVKMSVKSIVQQFLPAPDLPSNSLMGQAQQAQQMQAGGAQMGRPPQGPPGPPGMPPGPPHPPGAIIPAGPDGMPVGVALRHPTPPPPPPGHGNPGAPTAPPPPGMLPQGFPPTALRGA